MVIFKKVMIQKAYVHINIALNREIEIKFQNRYERTKTIQEQFLVNLGP